MLETLKIIHWPDGIQPTGPVIRAALLGQVGDYDSLILQAKLHAESIKNKSELDAREQTELIRNQTANSVKSDFETLKELLNRHREEILNRSSSVCVEVAKIALGNFIESLDEQRKISEMVELLVRKLHSKSNLTFTAHPAQVKTLGEVLSKGFNQVLRSDEFKVKADNTLEMDQIRVNSIDDAFIDISMRNMVAILIGEIEQIKEELEVEIKGACELESPDKNGLNRETI